MIGETYRARAAQALFGEGRSALMPSVWWLSWLSTSGVELGSRVRVNIAGVFEQSGDGVANVEPIDGGIAGAWIVGGVAFYDAATGGARIVEADVSPTTTTSAGDALAIAPGDLTLVVAP